MMSKGIETIFSKKGEVVIAEGGTRIDCQTYLFTFHQGTEDFCETQQFIHNSVKTKHQ